MGIEKFPTGIDMVGSQVKNLSLENVTSNTHTIESEVAYRTDVHRPTVRLNGSTAFILTDADAAGGDMTGTLANLQIAAGAVGNAEVNGAAAIAYSKLNLTASIVSGDIVDGTITNVDINAAAGITNAKLLVSTDFDFNTHKGINVTNPTSPQDIATKAYVDAGLVGGSLVKLPVRVATTVNGAIATAYANGQVVDGQTLATGDRILIKNTTGVYPAGVDKGIYIVQASGAPVRATDADVGSELSGALVAVSVGTANANTLWLQQIANLNIGSDVQTWTKVPLSTFIQDADISASASIAYSKLNLNASIVSADIVDGTIANVDINAAAAIAYSKLNLASSIVSADIVDGTIANVDINAAAAIAYSKLNLGTSIVNADIAPAAAIVYSKLNLGASILNTDINAAAAIASTKLAVTADFPYAGFKITGLGDPTSAQDAATKAYVDASIQGLAPKESVRTTTSTPGTLASSFENGDVVNGVTLVTGNRILIKDQASGAENGIYVVNASGAPTRATDADSTTDIESAYVMVEEGTQAGTGWLQTADNVTIGSTGQVWVQFSGAGTNTASHGVTLVGVDFQALADPTPATIVIGAGGISVNATKVGLKVTGLMGNGSLTTLTITHNLNNQYPIVQMVEVSSGSIIHANPTWTSVNACSFVFATAPANNDIAYTVVG